MMKLPLSSYVWAQRDLGKHCDIRWKIKAKTHKEQNTILGREAMKNAYKNTVSQMEKEKERLNIYEFDLVYFVNKVKLLLKKSEFDENTAEAILEHVKSVNEDLKKISNGEKLQFF